MVSMNTYSDAPTNILPPEVSSEIWADAINESAVMSLANRIHLPAVGLAVPMITGDPTAEWVGETDEITADDSTLDSREMKGHKIGVIETFSKEFRRDLPRLYEEMRRRLPRTIGLKFDQTVFHSASTPVNFQTFDSFQKSGVQSLSLTEANAYEDLVNIDEAVALAGGDLTAYALAPKARGVLLKATDNDGRPLLINDIQRQGSIDQLLGVPVRRTPAVGRAGASGEESVIGIAGEWSNAFYGVVQDIQIEVSDQATITKGSGVGAQQINLWQRDMFAVKVTAHLGFMIRKGREDRFVTITDGVEVD